MSELPEPIVSKPVVVVVDDEADILELISIHLQKSGFQPRLFNRIAPLLSYLQTDRPDLLILDLMLPDGDGLDLCRRLKSDPVFRSIPVLILTARSEEIDIVLGLELGADDYMAKPFSPKELVARVRAILRRGASFRPAPDVPPVTIGGLLRLDTNRFTVTVAGNPVELTATEFNILKLLSRTPGWVFSREKILEIVRGDDTTVYDRTVDVHIRHLRTKLGPAGALIKNIRGAGYKIDP
jgi:DNA-binding response OmpR family regulator